MMFFAVHAYVRDGHLPTVSTCRNLSFSMHNPSFSMQSSSFLIQNPSLLMKSSSFLMKDSSFSPRSGTPTARQAWPHARRCDCLKIVWRFIRSRLISTFFRLSCDWLGFCFRRILDWFSKREWPILTDYGLSFDGVWTDFLTRNGLFWRTAFQQPCEWHPGRAERTVILH